MLLQLRLPRRRNQCVSMPMPIARLQQQEAEKQLHFLLHVQSTPHRLRPHTDLLLPRALPPAAVTLLLQRQVRCLCWQRSLMNQSIRVLLLLFRHGRLLRRQDRYPLPPEPRLLRRTCVIANLRAAASTAAATVNSGTTKWEEQAARKRSSSRSIHSSKSILPQTV
jgi:hypothetical protein